MPFDSGADTGSKALYNTGRCPFAALMSLRASLCAVLAAAALAADEKPRFNCLTREMWSREKKDYCSVCAPWACKGACVYEPNSCATPPCPKYRCDAADHKATSALLKGDVCYQFCEDGSKPFVNRRSACAPGLTCQAPELGEAMFFDTCHLPETCLGRPQQPCHEKKCGETCVVEGDMAGLCDLDGKCSFDYSGVSARCAGLQFPEGRKFVI